MDFDSANWISIGSTFVYNSTITTVSSSDITQSGDNVIMSHNFIVPAVASQLGATFFWNVSLSNSTGTFYFQSDINNQTINPFSIDDCSVETLKILEFNMVDEKTQIPINFSINGTIDLTVELFSTDISSRIINFSQSFTNTNNASVCVNSDLFSGGNESYSLFLGARYVAEGYASEIYNIQNASLDNQTATNLFRNITLFDLRSSESTDFKIIFKDKNFLPIDDALIQINRQYLSEGTFKTVEIPLTDSNGEAVAHLVQNDAVYNLIITKNGTILASFNNRVAFCDDQVAGFCVINLNALTPQENVFVYDAKLGITFDLSYSETTRDISLDFVTCDTSGACGGGSPRNVTLESTKLDLIETQVCITSVISASGTLTCNVPPSIGNETITVKISVDGEETYSQLIRAGQDISLGAGGYIIMFFMVITLVMMLLDSKAMMVVGVVLGYIISLLFFLLRGGIIGTSASVMWLIITAIILIWKLGKRRIT